MGPSRGEAPSVAFLDHLAAQLKDAWPTPSFMLRLRGAKACKSWDQQASLRVLAASRLLRQRDMVGAELELEAAVSSAERSEQQRDPAALRAVLESVRRTLFRPEYEAALGAADEAPTPEERVVQLKRARRVAEEPGEKDDVRRVDRVMEAPTPEGAGPEKPEKVVDPSLSPEEVASLRKTLAGPAPLTREEQRAQFQRVARDSRAYASKRLKNKPK